MVQPSNQKKNEDKEKEVVVEKRGCKGSCKRGKGTSGYVS